MADVPQPHRPMKNLAEALPELFTAARGLAIRLDAGEIAERTAAVRLADEIDRVRSEAEPGRAGRLLRAAADALRASAPTLDDRTAAERHADALRASAPTPDE